MDSSTQERPWKSGFWSLIATQFQGAFNDTALKNLVIFLILAAGHRESDRENLELAVGALFSVPFILFSMTAGYLADHYSKRSVTIATKVFEIGIMVLAVVGLARQNLPMELTAVFLLSTQAAFFGPSKYGLLPEVLPQRLLSWGNGVLELGTFVAIILGSVAAGIMSDVFQGRHGWSGAIMLALAGIGCLLSLGITRVPAADPSRKYNYNLPGELWGEIRAIRRDRALWLAVVGNTYFWFLAALLQFNIFIYGKDILQISDTRSGLLQVAVAIGIGIGSLAAGYLSGNQIEYGLIPLGSIGLTLFAAALAFHGLTFSAVLSLLAALGFFAGFFAVPVSALIQHRPEETRKGKVLGVANLLSFVGVLMASVVYFLMQRNLHWQPPTVFLASAIASAATTAYVVWLLPDSFLRLVLWLLTHTLYRIKVEGRENFPARGGALLVPNHVSMVDAVLLIAATDRPIRFLMFKGSYEHPLVKPFAKMMRVIPVASNLGPRDLIHSLREATNALKDGEIVCIFPEGQMTRIGQMLPFRRGMERIMKGVEAPIIPVHLDGVWGSIFSFERGRFLWKLPRKIPYPVTVSFGKPMAPATTAVEVRKVVQDLGAEAYRHRKDRLVTLHRSFVRMARRHPRRFAMADGMTPRLNFGPALVRAVALSRRLRTLWKGQPMVGILLPPSVGGALVNFAALLQGKVPVNLNYTASDEVLASCAKQCELKTVISSRAFLEKVKLKVPGETIFLEDLASSISGTQKLSAFLISKLLPKAWLERACGSDHKITLDDIATIIFSSGSTGDPKGVMLSHYNVAANVDQVAQIFMLDEKDKILGILPFFHSFGFTGTLCMPAATGMGAVYHPSPLDARAIGALVSQYGVTFLLATPTFL
ncbi:MAG TPA: MFS transporter, partial [Terriglobales bacterium]